MKIVDHSGKKIWYEQYGGIFVSAKLKQALEYAGLNNIEFFPGFSRFAAG